LPTAFDAGGAWRWSLPAAVALLVLAWLVDFPVQRVWLGLGLLAAAGLVAWRPTWFFLLVAGSLPVLDLAPWSGRRGLDEFDILLALGAAVCWARLPARQPARPAPATSANAALALMLVSLALATGQALYPLAAVDPDALSNPLSPYAALRLAKAGLEALLLWWLARRWRAAGGSPGAAFGAGMVIALAGTVLCIFIERVAFSRLLDFDSNYRVAGPFSVMSLGGAYPECLLAVATPFLLVRLLPPVAPARLLAGALLLAGTAYCLMVTYSRGGYAAGGVGVLVLIMVMMLPARHRLQRAAMGTALAMLAAAAAYPVLAGSFAQSRLQEVPADLAVRERHWAQSLIAMEADGGSHAFGMGLGRYASVMALRGEKPGGHRLVSDGEGGTALRLGAGDAYYVDQIVALRPGQSYRLRFRFRNLGAGPGPWVALCKKWIIASTECSRGMDSEPGPPSSADPGAWREVSGVLEAPADMPDEASGFYRFSMRNGNPAPMEIDRLSLTGGDGAPVLRNGDFDAGFDHWTFTSDNHLAWQTKSLPLGVYFEQGWLGVIAMFAMLGVGAVTGLRAARQDRPDGAAVVAALCAFATVGIIDDLFNAPRFLLLWMMLCLLPSLLEPPNGARA
jgi:hypothetical protein